MIHTNVNRNGSRDSDGSKGTITLLLALYDTCIVLSCRVYLEVFELVGGQLILDENDYIGNSEHRTIKLLNHEFVIN